MRRRDLKYAYRGVRRTTNPGISCRSDVKDPLSYDRGFRVTTVTLVRPKAIVLPLSGFGCKEHPNVYISIGKAARSSRGSPRPASRNIYEGFSTPAAVRRAD
uniref:Uncharacterized protein n=1 Tax=Sipha flava TaxID=143950 RepID=A0A2S2QVS8_9HEMI